MSKQVINLSINVELIDKARLYKGKKGTYLDCTVFVTDTPDQYGQNGFVVQSITKEEREGGKKGVILGNVKLPKNSAGNGQYNPQTSVNMGNTVPVTPKPYIKPGDEELPF